MVALALLVIFSGSFVLGRVELFVMELVVILSSLISDVVLVAGEICMQL